MAKRKSMFHHFFSIASSQNVPSKTKSVQARPALARKAQSHIVDPDAADEAEMDGTSRASQARRRERERCVAIFSDPAALCNPDFAGHLAFNTTLSRSNAIAAMRISAGVQGGQSVSPAAPQKVSAAQTDAMLDRAFATINRKSGSLGRLGAHGNAGRNQAKVDSTWDSVFATMRRHPAAARQRQAVTRGAHKNA